LHWAAGYLKNVRDRSEIENLLPKNIYEIPFNLLDGFNKMIADKPHYEKSGRGALYSVSHSLAQAALAASKNRKIVQRGPETGEKCHLCGEFEVLHHIKFSGENAKAYSEGAKAFWSELKIKWDKDKKNNIA
jgi:CRISPR-associated protein Cmr2